jgi:membrane-bound lytic murein transglycosylase MltF
MLPATAADENVGIPDITTKDSNIHAGIRYLDFIRDRYFPDLEIDPVNQTLLAMASYNAGPNRIQSLRKKAAAQGLDPNKWFGNVEIVTAREVGREPVKYVANIYKYYITYRMTAVQMTARAEERKRQGVE